MTQHTTLLTRTQVSQLVGITEEDIGTYVTCGYLHPTHDGQEQLFMRHEVEQLMALRDSDRLPRLTPESILMLWAEIQTTRSYVDTMMRMLGLAQPPIALDPTALSQMYEKAVEALVQEEYTRAELEDWVTLFLRLRIGHVTALTTVTQNDRPWVMLFRLAQRLCLYVAEDMPVRKNPHLRSLAIQLDAARVHLKNLWGLAAELDPARDYRTRLMRTVPDLEEIVKSAASNRGISTIPPMMEHLLSETGIRSK